MQPKILLRLRAMFVAALVAITSMTGLALPANAYSLTCGSYGSTPSYACVSSTGYQGQNPWGYYAPDANGHNCTTYASYRLWQNNVPNPGGLGNAMDWNDKAADYNIPVNGTPAVGSIAVWEANHYPAKYTGHVAYVEAVTSSYIDISEDNYLGTTMRARYYTGEAAWPDHFIHFKDVAAAPTVPAVTSIKASTSDDTQYSGDFNGDKWDDIVLLHQLPDNGIGVHVLYGNTGSNMFNNQTWVRNLPASDKWNWSSVKVAAGRFNSDQYSDIALVHQRVDSGADVHVMYGGANGSVFSIVSFVRSLPGTDGWNWNQMKIVSADVNGNGMDDLVVVHRLADGAAGIHVLFGDTGSAMFTNPSTWIRNLPASQEWRWDDMKLALGNFTGDNTASLAIIHRLADNGMDIHILYGSTGGLFSNTSTFVRRLSFTDGWNWNTTKLAAGNFNGDAYTDITLLPKLADSSINVHVLFGNAGSYMFTDLRWIRTLSATDQWDWTKIKVASGNFNGDVATDIEFLHQRTDTGIDVHSLFGNAGSYMFADLRWIRGLAGSDGWNWAKII